MYIIARAHKRLSLWSHKWYLLGTSNLPKISAPPKMVVTYFFSFSENSPAISVSTKSSIFLSGFTVSEYAGCKYLPLPPKNIAYFSSVDIRIFRFLDLFRTKYWKIGPNFTFGKKSEQILNIRTNFVLLRTNFEKWFEFRTKSEIWTISGILVLESYVEGPISGILQTISVSSSVDVKIKGGGRKWVIFWGRFMHRQIMAGWE